MQEWVETLRSKLREMKILSPRENLYTKLPEIRAPLLPTRDPTSPLPAPPPVPAALVPGVERVTSHHANQHPQTSAITSTTSTFSEVVNPSITTTAISSASLLTFSSSLPTLAQPSLFTAMSNTLSQNLLNMLCDPLTAYSEQLNAVDETASAIGGSSSTAFLGESFENLSINNTEIKDQQNLKCFDNLTVDNNCLEEQTQLGLERDKNDKNQKKSRKEKKQNESILTIKSDTDKEVDKGEDRDPVVHRCSSSRRFSDFNSTNAVSSNVVLRTNADVLINPGLSAGKLQIGTKYMFYFTFLLLLFIFM